MRSWLWGSVTGVALALVAASCTESAFVCSSDDNCGAGGLCEADGFCSFADEECNSGRRYGDQSGEKSGECVASEQGSTGAMPQSTGLDVEPIDGSTTESPSSTGDASTGDSTPPGSSSSGGSIDSCTPPKGCVAEMFCDLVDPDWLSLRELIYGDGTLIFSTAEPASNYLYSSEPFDIRESTITQRVAVLPPIFPGTWVGMRVIDTSSYMENTRYTLLRWQREQVEADLFEAGGDDDAINPPEFLDLIVRSTGGTTTLGYATEDGTFVELSTGPTPAYFEAAWIWFELIDSDPDGDAQTELDFISICPTE